MTYDFIIYGSGLSSKLLALALSRSNFKSLIITNNKLKTNKTNLVTFLSDGSLKYMSEVLESKDIFNKSENIEKLNCGHLYSKKETKFEFKSQKHSILGKVVPNVIIDELLNNKIRSKSEYIHITDYQEVIVKNDDNKIIIKDKLGEIRTASLLFYSSSSQDNDLLKNFDFVEKKLNQIAISASVNIQRLQQNIAYQLFTTDGPVALLPIKDDKASMVWSLRKNSPILKLSKNNLESHLISLFKSYINDLEIINMQTQKLSFSYAKKIYESKTVLIGNIAHNIHPIAGQGFNLTIKDISKIVFYINKNYSLGLELNSNQTLESFSNNRKFDNFTFSFGTLAMENIFSSENNIIRFLTSKGLSFVDNSKSIKNIFIEKATGKYNFQDY
tara:strand:- start:784 stop:1944 length:1161 start_codon:yes stop_codon:yes gene_type:complete